MKAMTRQQIAAYAGVSVKTLRNWCKPYNEELCMLGLRPGMVVLPPRVCQWICDQFCINVD
jgi:hypothetical protein